MLPAGSVVSIHRLGQEHLIQHGNATNVAGLHAEDHEGFLLQGFGGDGNLTVGAVAGVEVLALGEEGILGRFDSL